jgi:hypothetical protein
METYHLWIASTAEPAGFLLQYNTYNDITGYLATLPYLHSLSEQGDEEGVESLIAAVERHNRTVYPRSRSET